MVNKDNVSYTIYNMIIYDYISHGIPWDDCIFPYMITIKKSTIHVGRYTSPMDPMGMYYIPKKTVLCLSSQNWSKVLSIKGHGFLIAWFQAGLVQRPFHTQSFPKHPNSKHW